MTRGLWCNDYYNEEVTQMPDKDNVLRGLTCLSGHGESDQIANPCSGCGYNSMPNFAICVYAVAADSLELLKEQEEQIRVLRLALDIAMGKGIHV